MITIIHYYYNLYKIKRMKYYKLFSSKLLHQFELKIQIKNLKFLDIKYRRTSF